MPQAVMVDRQAPHATTFEAPAVHTPPAEWQAEWYFNEHIPSNNETVFSRNYLLRSGRQEGGGMSERGQRSNSFRSENL